MTSPQFAPIAQLADALRDGRTTSRQLVEQALARIADPAGQGAIAFMHVDAENARAAADAHDALRRTGTELSPLAGIPVSIKDLFDIDGQITRAGSTALADALPAKADAIAVARLRRAGGVIMGRTNMSEFAFSGLGLNPHYGTPKSPYRADVPGDERIAGGSSSGAAASVADGMAAIALGTDTGGSIRIPAALCGLTGFKPTAARVPTQGGVPLSTTLDSFGPIGLSVACCALVDRILTGQDPYRLPAARPLDGIRLGVLTNFVTEGVDDHVANAMASALGHLSAAGALVEDVRFAPLDRLGEINRYSFASIEAHAWHRPLLAAHGDQYDPRVRVRIMKGAPANAADYIDLLHARAAMIEQARSLWLRFDAIVCPTVPVVPPRIADLLHDDDAFGRTNALILRNPSVFNFLDSCALSLPCHPRGEAPVGLMLAGPSFGDDALLAIGRAVEAVLESTR